MAKRLTLFSKILVANRGEIAVRVIRAIRSLGATSVAVYSDIDRFALHVQHADEAVYIGPSPAAESYLNIENILEAAKSCGVDAVHPGYGFLAESAEFAQAVIDAGMIFIGPKPDVIRLMGDKAAAKQLMAGNGVPTIPGYLGEDQSEDRLLAEALRIGFPIMLKAVAGGGGHGMRRIDREDRVFGGLSGCPARSGRRLRRRSHVFGEAAGRAAPHRDSDHGR